MVSKASLRYIRMSPRKFRLIIPLIKGKGAEQAIMILMAVKKRASSYAIDLLKSAIANAKKSQPNIDTATLHISNMVVGGGPQMKRFRAGSMGRASMIIKRTCHVTVELDFAKKHRAQAETNARNIKEISKTDTKISQGKAEGQAHAKKQQAKVPRTTKESTKKDKV